MAAKSAPTPALTLTAAAARAAWHRRQGLGGAGDLDAVPGGWSRSLGGVDPYLAMLARVPGLTRADIDARLADGRLWVGPGVRSCIWLMPTSHTPLALVAGDADYRRRNLRELDRLGVPEAEVRDIAEAAVGVLGGGPLPPEGIRDAVPSGLVRSLGVAGKKKGHNTALPVALRLLEADGRVVRRMARLDSQRYTWGLPEPDPLALGSRPADKQGMAEALAAHFLSWAGPACLSELVQWAKLAKGALSKALASLEAVPVAIEGLDELAWVLPGDLEGLRAPLDDDAVYLLTGQDNALSLRLNPGLVTDPAHHGVEIYNIGSRKAPLASSRWLGQRPLVHRGEIIGLWEWDPDAGEVVWATFAPLSADVQSTADRVGAFIRDELDGTAKAVSIDSVKAIRRRVDAVRALRE